MTKLSYRVYSIEIQVVQQSQGWFFLLKESISDLGEHLKAFPRHGAFVRRAVRLLLMSSAPDDPSQATLVSDPTTKAQREILNHE